MEERESPRPRLTDHCFMLPTFASPKGYKSSLVDSCKSSSVLLVSPLVAFMLSVIKARFSCILVNFTCRFEDSPSVPERSYKQSVDILG